MFSRRQPQLSPPITQQTGDWSEWRPLCRRPKRIEPQAGGTTLTCSYLKTVTRHGTAVIEVLTYILVDIVSRSKKNSANFFKERGNYQLVKNKRKNYLFLKLSILLIRIVHNVRIHWNAKEGVEMLQHINKDALENFRLRFMWQLKTLYFPSIIK